MSRRDPMRPGSRNPAPPRWPDYAILAVCLVVAASFLYAIRRRYIPR